MTISKQMLLYVIVLTTFFVGVAQEDSTFVKANAYYAQENYEEAIAYYESILSKGKHSDAVYYNLANAHYKLGHIAHSIYFYEKALQLSPNDNDVLTNITFAQNMTIDNFDAVPDAGIAKLIKAITTRFSFDTWAKLTVALVLVFTILFLGYYFSIATTIKRTAFIGSIAALITSVISLSLAFNHYNTIQNNTMAIVFAKESGIKTEPNNRGEEVFKLHEGTKVRVLDSLNDWKKIKVINGNTGWILSEDIKEL